jgi:hypothetical protein
LIYLDTSVALAQIMSEERRPGRSFWEQPIASSQLLRYEIWNRLHVYRAGKYRQGKAREVLRRAILSPLSDEILSSALRPFPIPVRTLDGLHLATLRYLKGQGATVELASYDLRMIEAAQALDFRTLQP